VDLLAAIAVAALLAGWFGFNRLGERGRIARCARNLAVLGQAMHGSAHDHNGGLPPAGMETPETTWDIELVPYAAPQLGQSKSPTANRQLIKSIASSYLCPSDSVKRDRPRSYSMPAHDMKPENWPPGPGNSTGVGLWWSRQAVRNQLGDDADEEAQGNRDILPAISLSDIPHPADTLLLTELIQRDNRLASASQVRVASAEDQRAAFRGDLSRFHGGRFNYLMADGHVELLTPLQTGSISGSAGIWSVRKGSY
jgi:prepilin-type processing-associated H-X9-DG protein